jgi:predicted CXXCH cytochrome family protein
MKTPWTLPHASTLTRWVREKQSSLLWSAGAGASVALVLISCGTTGRTMMAPPNTVPGATFVGTKECATCHEKLVRDFRTADHAKLQAKGKNAIDMGCESCHGPGSKHVEAGGGSGTIVNPKKSPQTCFQCHLDKQAEFRLPYSHPVLAGKMTCSDCHNPHKGNAVKGGGTQLSGKNETCYQCHKSQFGPFVFSHDAVREGCSTCHNAHGSVNQKLLTERNNTLCLKCHIDANTKHTGQMGSSSNHFDPGGDAARGSCWSAGCHFSVHGSNVNNSLRY